MVRKGLKRMRIRNESAGRSHQEYKKPGWTGTAKGETRRGRRGRDGGKLTAEGIAA